VQTSIVEPLVSILIPAFNEEEFIAETLRSALSQTWSRKEIIVVDDGSTDSTVAIARSFAHRGVTVVSEPHRGAAAARNKAFSMCAGDYIQWLDADDLLAPDKIAKQLEGRTPGDNSRVLFSSAWGRFKYRHYKAEFAPSGLWCDLSAKEWLLRKLEENVYMQTAAWLVSRDLTEAAGPWNTQLSLDDDGEYFARIALLSDAIRFVPEAKVFYRIAGAGSLSYLGWSNEKIESQLSSMELTIRYLRSLDDGGRVRRACVTYLQNNLSTFFPARPDIVGRVVQIARELGGRLEQPPLSWKYSWLARVFGDRPAKYAQILLPRIKLSMVRSWDKALFRLETTRRPL
jgi:glycosyltransferase involved in cell wall biosynthesis